MNTIIDKIDLWTTAQELKTSNRGRSASNQSLLGIKKLRELILELAVRGQLVPHDPNDEPASELLKKIEVEKRKLIKEGKIKKQAALTDVGDDEKLIDLPEGWKLVRLSDYYDVRDGTHDSPKKKLEGYPLVSSKNLYTGKLDFSDITYISEEDFIKINERSKVDKGDILFAMIGTIGNPVIVDVDVEFAIKNVALFKYYSRKLSSPNYLQFFLKLASIEMKEKALGGVQSFISLGKLREYLMPLPPLAEQHRIVAKVDELMALCDELENQQTNSNVAHETLVSTLLGSLTDPENSNSFDESWQRIANHFGILFSTEHSIDQLKQAILQLAVMGKLVPQNPEDEPASELLKKIAKEKARLVKEGKIKKQAPLPEITDDERPFKLPEGWEWVRLNDAIDVRDGTHDTPKEASGENTYPLVTSKNFENGNIKFDEAKRISAEDHFEISKRSNVERLDILFSMIGGNLGNQVMVNDDIPFSIKNVALFKYYNMEYTSPFFVKKIMEHIALDLQNKSIGGAQPFVSLGYLRNIIIPLPPIAEQHRIVAKVDELFAMCEELKKCLVEAQNLQNQMAVAVVEQALAIQPKENVNYTISEQITMAAEP